MLHKLGVSKSECHLELCEDSKVNVTVIFNISTLLLEGATGRCLESNLHIMK